jgi:hypothetical protein
MAMTFVRAPIVPRLLASQLAVGGECDREGRRIGSPIGTIQKCVFGRTHDVVCLSLHDDGGDFQFSAAEGIQEGVHDTRIEIRSRTLDDHVSRFEERHGLPVGTIARQ